MKLNRLNDLLGLARNSFVKNFDKDFPSKMYFEQRKNRVKKNFQTDCKLNLHISASKIDIEKGSARYWIKFLRK